MASRCGEMGPGPRRPVRRPTPAGRRAGAARWTRAAGPAPGGRQCWTGPPSRSHGSAKDNTVIINDTTGVMVAV